MKQMAPIDSLILVPRQDAAFHIELLSCTVFDHLASAAAAFSPHCVFSRGLCAGKSEFSVCLAADDPAALVDAYLLASDAPSVLLLFKPSPVLSPQTLNALAQLAESANGAAVLRDGDEALAVLLPRESLEAYDFGDFSDLSAAQLCEDLNAVAHDVPPAEKHIVTDTVSAYYAQEALRARINYFWMEQGVFLMDPNTTYISPLARIGAGSVVLPGCFLNGRTSVGEGCRIGPNSLLQNADIGDRVTVNSSQILDSSVGDDTTVGPFAYIRPGSLVGKKARIGDFVELKKARIGDGTKVAHLTYLGDATLGERVNVGCGVVTVNYDGKNKYHTTVGDDSFIGCNVNLVSPVTVGRGSYLAAGTTVTDEVAEDSLCIGRVRATVKPGWAKKRRESGKL